MEISKKIIGEKHLPPWMRLFHHYLHQFLLSWLSVQHVFEEPLIFPSSASFPWDPESDHFLHHTWSKKKLMINTTWLSSGKEPCPALFYKMEKDWGRRSGLAETKFNPSTSRVEKKLFLKYVFNFQAKRLQEEKKVEDIVKFYTQFLELKMIRKHMVYSQE